MMVQVSGQMGELLGRRRCRRRRRRRRLRRLIAIVLARVSFLHQVSARHVYDE